MRTHVQLPIFARLVSLVLLLVLVTQQILAAQPPQAQPRPGPVDALTASGDRYLSSIAQVTQLGVQFSSRMTTLTATALADLLEADVVAARDTALAIAEHSAVALGAVDDLSGSVEAVNPGLLPAVDVAARVNDGLPDELRQDLTAASGWSAARVDALEAQLEQTTTTRLGIAAHGLPADLAVQLADAGFTQTEIDQITQAMGAYGLADGSLTTSLAQFRVTQDELAATRTRALLIGTQLIGKQIAVRQAQGSAPRPVTDGELNLLVNDVVRLLIHAAEIDRRWGSDTRLDVGEGHWWMIERTAQRAAERLSELTVESQNRGLVVELLLLQQIQTLALTARGGDAAYVKPELDQLAELLAAGFGADGLLAQQRNEGTTAQAWPGGHDGRLLMVRTARARLDAVGVVDLTAQSGGIAEADETNNSKGLLFAAGQPLADAVAPEVIQSIIQTLREGDPEKIRELIWGILSGDTDDPVVLLINIGLSLIPVLGAIPDVLSLIFDASIFVRAVSLIGILGSLADLFALIPGLQPIGAGSVVADAAAAVIKALYRLLDSGVQRVLDALSFRQSFSLAIDLIKVMAGEMFKLGISLAQDLQTAIAAVMDFMTGAARLWQSFVAFVQRVGVDGLTRFGFTPGSRLAGRILSLGESLSDEALGAVKRIGDDLANAGIDLHDEAALGLHRLAGRLDATQLQRLIEGFKRICLTAQHPISRAKLAAPLRQGSDCRHVLNQVFPGVRKWDDLAITGGNKLLKSIDPSDVAALLTKYADDADSVNTALTVIGTSKVTTWALHQADELVKLAQNGGGVSAKVLQELPFNVLDANYYPGFSDFLKTYPLDVPKLNQWADAGSGDKIRGELSRGLIGKYREVRLQQYVRNPPQGSPVPRQTVLVQHNNAVNEAGYDLISRADDGSGRYFLGEAKDKGGSAGTLLEGPKTRGEKLKVDEFQKYFEGTQATGYTFNQTYFDKHLEELVADGALTLEQRDALRQALTDGKLEVIVYAGGRADPFTRGVLRISPIRHSTPGGPPIIVHVISD